VSNHATRLGSSAFMRGYEMKPTRTPGGSNVSNVQEKTTYSASRLTPSYALTNKHGSKPQVAHHCLERSSNEARLLELVIMIMLGFVGQCIHTAITAILLALMLLLSLPRVRVPTQAR